MKKKILFVIVLFGLLFTTKILGQDSTSVYRITLEDDSEFIGKIISENDGMMIFRTLSGTEIKVAIAKITDKEKLEGSWDGSNFVKQDPNSSRLLFAPTARTLKAGKGYFADYELFLPFVAVGLTDFITISGGVSLIPGAKEQLLYFAPKIALVQDTYGGLSAGVFYMHIEKHSFGIAYGVGTYGSRTAGVTFGLGYGFADGEFAKSPVVMLGGEAQLSNSVKLVSENWIFPEIKGALISFAVRFFGDHLAADFGLMTSTEAEGSFPFVPWLGFCYNF
jgi:hypothetical protein